MKITIPSCKAKECNEFLQCSIGVIASAKMLLSIKFYKRSWEFAKSFFTF